MAKQLADIEKVSMERMAEIFQCRNAGIPVLLSVNEVAKITGLSVSKLNKNRQTGEGPAFKKIGKVVKYPLDVVMAWADRPMHNAAIPMA